ncbi:hypothetical protein KUV51_00770 [Tateyamaria omphalii]|uniref:hypothetical protein n=1 Tax=Tateyamaria omphalii TaxID=299262 RepID=UPI001C9A0063|nr:hypothetical protein [Tateyamaria omphalii]MBY5931513.1 hypothetical protein [Tateyamaria omphalii]
MHPSIRQATPQDIPGIVELLLTDAADRQTVDAVLWKMGKDAAADIHAALTFALTSDKQPFQQIWHVAEHEGAITGVVHSMLLPVPPIYAGSKGEPGLILPDAFVAPGAAHTTAKALIEAAEQALRDAGAQIILTSLVTSETWQDVFDERGYAPLTLYLSRTGLAGAERPANIRSATQADISGIVARSAEHRQVLFDIDPFWETHVDADTRFAAWMTRSLSLPDRDMMVLGPPDSLGGYVIAQPASRLHFPPAHDIGGTGVIDDYFHTDFADVETLAHSGDGAIALLHAAEAAFVARGIDAVFVVCPAAWHSKIELLKMAGYETAMVWSIKRD